MLSHVVARYLDARDASRRAEAAYKAMPASQPEQPAELTTEEAYLDYVARVREYQDRINAAKDAEKAAWALCSQAQRSILDLLPIPNTWFKVAVAGEEYAIGKCWDVWGGGHYAFVIREWGQHTQGELTDRTYYP